MDLYRALTCNTSLIRYRFPYFGADLRNLVLQSGTSEHTIVHGVFRTRVLDFGGDNFRGLQMRDETSVSKTIRKPLLVKAQTALKTKRIKYGRWNSYTLQRGTIMTLISPGDCTLQCGTWLWNHDSEFTKWLHPAM